MTDYAPRNRKPRQFRTALLIVVCLVEWIAICHLSLVELTK